MLNCQSEFDLIFRALSDPTLRAITKRLTLDAASTSELAEPLSMLLAAVLKHIRVRAVLHQQSEALSMANAWLTSRRTK
jgi:DNA-binding transcriptional ArsR family regulator